MKTLPATSLRGAIRSFIESNSHRLGDNVIEVGTRQHDPRAWWVSNRDLATGSWLGVDFQPGPGVDYVADLESLPWAADSFSGAVVSEVLEHVRKPWRAASELHRVLRPGGIVLITVPFSFPVHSYPSDYYRYTLDGLRELFSDFSHFEGRMHGECSFTIDDHGSGLAKVRSPIHTFAVAVK